MSRVMGGMKLARFGVMAVGVFAAAAFLVPAGAAAATITVGPTDDVANGAFDDTGCTLRDAIIAANTNASDATGCNGDNGGGTGIDTILLQGGQTYTLTQHAVPDDVTTSFTGKGDLDIDGGGGTIIRSVGPGLATIDADSANFPGPANNTRGRALDILSGAGGVTLDGIRVTGGMVTDGTGGGGIRSSAPLTLINSEVTGNFTGILATDVLGGWGGGIEVQDPGALTMSGSTVANNTARANPFQNGDEARGGGIFYGSSSHPFNATNSTISGNVVDSQGDTGNETKAGGILWQGLGGVAKMNLTNVTVSDNSAIDSKVGGDTTQVSGGGIEIFEANNAVSNATITNSVIAGNTAPQNADCVKVNPDDDFISGGNNVFGDFSACGIIGGSNDTTFADADLGPLSNYGGLTRTQILNPGSPAVDRGGSCPDTDQRGFFRAPVAPCDAGAVELNAPASLPPPGSSPPPGSALTSPVVPSTPHKKCRKKHKAAAVAKKCKKKRR